MRPPRRSGRSSPGLQGRTFEGRLGGKHRGLGGDWEGGRLVGVGGAGGGFGGKGLEEVSVDRLDKPSGTWRNSKQARGGAGRLFTTFQQPRSNDRRGGGGGGGNWGYLPAVWAVCATSATNTETQGGDPRAGQEIREGSSRIPKLSAIYTKPTTLDIPNLPKTYTAHTTPTTPENLTALAAPTALTTAPTAPTAPTKTSMVHTDPDNSDGSYTSDNSDTLTYVPAQRGAAPGLTHL